MSVLLKDIRLLLTAQQRLLAIRCMCSNPVTKSAVEILGKSYPSDEWTNITPSIIKKIGKKLHTQEDHPLGLINKQIQNFFYSNYLRAGNPIFSMYDHLSPVVTLEQNFDNLLVPSDHPSRNTSDSYYLNNSTMLRAHTTAHQRDLISSGLDSFLITGDVYRRDTVDASHYPVFHQLDGVRLFSKHQLFKNASDVDTLSLFETGSQTELKQEVHTMEAALTVAHELKNTLQNLAQALFGSNIEYRWVEEQFPFTHPSWELEINYQNKWMEVLGCGVIKQEILQKSGAVDKVGWAFGMGLERLAMKLYSIPDIRLFWSEDPRFISQFKVDDPSKKVTFKPFSKHPQVVNDISFWIPENYHEHDFYDIIRSTGGDIVENVELIDVFNNTKKKRTSHCYRITYRHMEKALTQCEVGKIHEEIASIAEQELNVQIR